MSASISAPNPCLLAILLICQTRSDSGPQLAFHWPPDPLKQARDSADSESNEDSDASSEDSDSWYSDQDHRGDNAGADRYSSGPGSSILSSTRRSTRGSNKVGDGPDNGRTQSTLFGYDEDGLVSLLTPDKSWHKRKFELSLNDLTFVGRPVFSRHDGTWKKRRKSTMKQQKTSQSDIENTTEDEVQTDPEKSMKEAKPQAVVIKSELTMFHLVFVMNPPALDHSRRVKDMYDSVIKKFARALKLLQTKQDYVWQQVEILLTKKQQLHSNDDTEASVSMQDLLNCSLLSSAIGTIFTAISTSKIASVQLVPGMQLPLQIPPVTSSAYLPSLTESPIPPGLWLTTATEAAVSAEAADKVAPSTTLELAKTYTLLLRSAPQKIARDAQAAGGPLADHLPRFVAALRPTKSFWKLSQQHKISLADIQLQARHLIYWRRAVIIPPLHQRDIYIVSPNADFGKLEAACKSYRQQFPASLPSLPKLLSVLSGIPRPFGTLIPSHDHKETYMFLLAWLLRNGLVTQLRTFAYIRVGSEVKRKALERERSSKEAAKAAINVGQDEHAAHDIAGSTSTRPSFVSRQSSDGRQSLRDGRSLKVASLIKSPSRATPAESTWLNHIHDSMLDEDGIFGQFSADEREELYQYWQAFSKHFDGNTALETVSIKENMKRVVAWNLFTKLGLNFNGGVEKDGENKTVLVTVRHW